MRLLLFLLLVSLAHAASVAIPLTPNAPTDVDPGEPPLEREAPRVAEARTKLEAALLSLGRSPAATAAVETDDFDRDPEPARNAANVPSAAALARQKCKLQHSLFPDYHGTDLLYTSGYSSAPSPALSENEKPLRGYPLVSAYKEYGRFARPAPGLLLAMNALQSGADREAVAQILDETLCQVNQASLQRPKAFGLPAGDWGAGMQAAMTEQLLGMVRDPHVDRSDLAPLMAAAESVASPLVLDLDGNGVLDTTTPTQLAPFVSAGATFFDVGGTGEQRITEWLRPGHDGLLALDANGNGVVDGPEELFGDASGHADGFVKLRLLDANGDGVLTGAELDHLSVWVDDGDGVCQPGELRPVKSYGISSISLAARGNEGSFVRDGRTYRMWDWWPRRQ